MEDDYRVSLLTAILTLQEAHDRGEAIGEYADMVARSPYIAGNTLDYKRAAALLADHPQLVPLSRCELQERTRRLISLLIDLQLPAWARHAPAGRAVVRTYCAGNATQCLDLAGLLQEPPERDVVEWWDTLATRVREDISATALRNGRAAEELSFQLEATRLFGLTPEWVAVEDNRRGFDLLSYVSHDGNERLAIEVKSTAASSSRLLLTRNEWLQAERWAPQWRLDFWDLATKQCRHFTIENIGCHIPTDHGNGRWQKVEISVD